MQRRPGSRWQKKWVVLTETSLAYFDSKGDSDPKIIVLLEKTTVTRLAAELGFCITNDSLFKAKHVGNAKSIEFQCASAQSLSEWLFPLGALAGVKQGEAGNWAAPEQGSTVATEVFEDNVTKDVNDVIFAGYLKKVGKLCLHACVLYALTRHANTLTFLSMRTLHCSAALVGGGSVDGPSWRTVASLITKRKETP